MDWSKIPKGAGRQVWRIWMVTKAVLWLSLPFSPAAFTDAGKTLEVDSIGAVLGEPNPKADVHVNHKAKGTTGVGGGQSAEDVRGKMCTNQFDGLMDERPDNCADRSHRIILYDASPGRGNGWAMDWHSSE